jgi:hypothetical protein
MLTKKATDLAWTIVSPQGRIERTGVAAEQIHVSTFSRD